MSYGVTPQERAANRRVALLVPMLPVAAVALAGVVAGVILAVVGLGLVVLFVAAGTLVLGGLLTALGLLAAPTHVERLLGARRIPDGTQPRIENIVAGLCATFGVASPPVFVVDDPSINLAMVATPTGSVMVVTTGLLDDLDLIELEGVVAHGLAHLRLDAVRRGTLAATLPGYLASDRVRHALAGRGRLLRADEVAAATVRYPVGIASVLDRCLAQPVPAAGSLFASERFARTRWLWFDPSPCDHGTSLGDVDAPIVRAEVLAEW